MHGVAVIESNTKRSNANGEIATAVLFGVLAVAFIAIVWGAFWGGLTLSVLWGWFVVPVFGLPALGVAQAYGLALVVRAVRGGNLDKSPDDQFGVVMVKAIVTPPLACALLLGVGWVAKAWA